MDGRTDRMDRCGGGADLRIDWYDGPVRWCGGIGWRACLALVGRALGVWFRERR